MFPSTVLWEQFHQHSETTISVKFYVQLWMRTQQLHLAREKGQWSEVRVHIFEGVKAEDRKALSMELFPCTIWGVIDSIRMIINYSKLYQDVSYFLLQLRQPIDLFSLLNGFLVHGCYGGSHLLHLSLPVQFFLPHQKVELFLVKLLLL